MENLNSFTVKEGVSLSCISFFGAGVGKLGIRNNCKNCMVAVVNWTPTVGVKYYRIEGYSQITIDMESSTGQLIGEQPCN